MHRDLVVIGGSAGAIEALLMILPRLPAAFKAAVVVVVHLSPTSKSVLPRVLGHSSALPVDHAKHGETILPGRVYVAPPAHHLLVHGDRLLLTRGPRENTARPAIDPLFRSVARWRGPRAIGVLLSGALQDGVAGLFAMKSRGAVTIAQSPSDASFPELPENALGAGVVDRQFPAARIADELVRLLEESIPTSAPTGVPIERFDDENARNAPALDEKKCEMQGPPSGYSCPDCGGVLWELHDGELIRYRCRIGHAHSQASLMAAQLDAVEEAMWSAYRILEERAALAKSLANRARGRGLVQIAEVHETQEADALARARQLRQALEEPR